MSIPEPVGDASGFNFVAKTLDALRTIDEARDTIIAALKAERERSRSLAEELQAAKARAEALEKTLGDMRELWKE